MFVLFLELESDAPGPRIQGLKNMDWLGITILSGSTSGIIFGLTSGGTVHPWASVRVLAPLVIGGGGLVLFGWYEEYVAGRHGLGLPFIPLRLASTRTAASGFLNVFLHAIVVWAISYYLLLYVRRFLWYNLIKAAHISAN